MSSVAFETWRGSLGIQCDAVVSAYADLMNHVDNLVDIPDLSDEDKELATALVAIKTRNMHSQLFSIGVQKTCCHHTPKDSGEQEGTGQLPEQR